MMKTCFNLNALKSIEIETSFHLKDILRNYTFYGHDSSIDG